ncbi:MAG: hypothetical protein GOMPHAMPRED_000579 [Gomphillus americanus]|uniref:Uncharacterized protein n=1 Tax=Gomphillus americanus TaxID=1940652 RepID=A0A8H3I1P6_9LECA|nr:MAG: hypothetical protein GOMPHAMPRED_000579 [Gomphillus americanus]
MPGHDDRKYREEVYIERRHSESPSRYATAPVPPPPRGSVPSFNPVSWEPERGRSSVSSRSSSVRPSGRAQMIAYDDQIRAHSVDGRRRDSSRHSVSSRGSYAMPMTPPAYPEEYIRHRRDSSRHSTTSRNSSIASHPCVEDPTWTSADEAARAKKARNKQLLYNGLAAITTIAATNNIYQSAKGYKERKEAVRYGEITEEEARSARKKSIAMDLFSVGVGAICVNNAVQGWKKTKSMKAEEEIRQAQWDHHVRDERRKSMVGY